MTSKMIFLSFNLGAEDRAVGAEETKDPYLLYRLWTLHKLTVFPPKPGKHQETPE